MMYNLAINLSRFTDHNRSKLVLKQFFFHFITKHHAPRSIPKIPPWTYVPLRSQRKQQGKIRQKTHPNHGDSGIAFTPKVCFPLTIKIDISSTSPYRRASSYLIVRAFISFGVVGVQTSPWFRVFYSWLRWLPDSIQWNRLGVSLDDAFTNRYAGTIPLD